ncbi:MAG: hypothetical protein ACI97K_003391 [Glaciecola sp.]|jgi:hypothetical protein
MALLAESCSGFIVGINLLGYKSLLIKRMNLHHAKGATSDMKAVESLTSEPMFSMQITDKGEVNIMIFVSEVTKIEPVKYERMCTMESKR